MTSVTGSGVVDLLALTLSYHLSMTACGGLRFATIDATMVAYILVSQLSVRGVQA